ncbi:MAG: 50S ribosomal protein L7ae [Oscillospiraceae bacterium]|nr:50S ribosomal protein L7ae [Oscillospiraceae bacterium]
MTDSALSLLGLALRGNNLAIGEEPVAEACKAGRARLVLTAADAAQNSADRAGRMAELGGVPWVRLPWDKETLGRALGRRLCAVAALTDRGLAAALAEKLAGRDEDLRPIASLLNETKKSRAGMKRPAAPEI